MHAWALFVLTNPMIMILDKAPHAHNNHEMQDKFSKSAFFLSFLNISNQTNERLSKAFEHFKAIWPVFSNAIWGWLFMVKVKWMVAHGCVVRQPIWILAGKRRRDRRTHVHVHDPPTTQCVFWCRPAAHSYNSEVSRSSSLDVGYNRRNCVLQKWRARIGMSKMLLLPLIGMIMTCLNRRFSHTWLFHSFLLVTKKSTFAAARGNWKTAHR